jgi:predicted XRE-type DNA-binding protein
MTKITNSSGNVFADIGVADPETHQLKAELVCRIDDLITSLKLTQAEATERMGMTQLDVAKMLRGQFRPISLERLLRCLVALGQSVAIDIGKPLPDRGKPPNFTFETGATHAKQTGHRIQSL